MLADRSVLSLMRIVTLEVVLVKLRLPDADAGADTLVFPITSSAGPSVLVCDFMIDAFARMSARVSSTER